MKLAQLVLAMTGNLYRCMDTESMKQGGDGGNLDAR